MKIPKVLHRIWLRESPQDIPAESKKYWAKWQQLHPDWELRTWDGTEFKLTHQDIYDVLPNLGARSDLLRYELLYREGGVYVDADVEPMRNIEPMIEDMTAFCGKHSAGCSNFLIGAPPEYEGLKTILDIIQRTRTPADYARMSRTETYELTGPDRISPVFHSRWDATMIEWGLVCDPKDGKYTRHHRAGLWLAEPASVGKNQPYTTIEKLKIGTGAAVKIGKAKLRIGHARPDTIAYREKICGGCSYGRPCYGGSSTMCCGAMADAFNADAKTCGCQIQQKILLASEECPYGKWIAEDKMT